MFARKLGNKIRQGRLNRLAGSDRSQEIGGGRARPRSPWRWGVPLVVLAMGLRLAWVLAVPTVPVGDFATYRESANYLVEFGSLDHGFIYMPGFVMLLAAVRSLGGELYAQKLLGVFFGALAAAAIFGITARLGD